MPSTTPKELAKQRKRKEKREKKELARCHRRAAEEMHSSESSDANDFDINAQQYTVIKTLGNGLSGHVYLVSKGDDDVPTALKIVPLDTEAHERHAAAEAMALLRLNEARGHDGVPKLRYEGTGTDVASGKMFHYFDMSYASGGDLLSALLGEGGTPVAESQLRVLAYKLCSTVAFAHSRGVCHRDIKLESMFFLAFFDESEKMCSGSVAKSNTKKKEISEWKKKKKKKLTRLLRQRLGVRRRYATECGSH
jgi:serine/threonine protein kinase